jgi:hypothetical protein
MGRRDDEDREYEANSRYDDVSERFSGEFSPCPVCGVMTVDAEGHCEGRFPNDEEEESA